MRIGEIGDGRSRQAGRNGIAVAKLTLAMGQSGRLQDYYESTYEWLITRGTKFQTLNITGLKWTEIDTHDDFAATIKMFDEP